MLFHCCKSPVLSQRINTQAHQRSRKVLRACIALTYPDNRPGGLNPLVDDNISIQEELLLRDPSNDLPPESM